MNLAGGSTSRGGAGFEVSKPWGICSLLSLLAACVLRYELSAVPDTMSACCYTPRDRWALIPLDL